MRFHRRDTVMTVVVSASEAKNNLGALLNRVRRNEETVIVENRGAPAAAIISISEFEKLQELKERARREEALAKLREIRAQLEELQKDMTEEEAEALLEEITKDVMDGVLAKTKLRFEE